MVPGPETGLSGWGLSGLAVLSSQAYRPTPRVHLCPGEQPYTANLPADSLVSLTYRERRVLDILWCYIRNDSRQLL